MMAETLLLVGLLFGAGTYLVLRAGFTRILFGFVLLTNAANLLVLMSSGDPAGKGAPVVGAGSAPVVDPLPQALVLTAIVIGFGVTAYLVTLLYRIYLDHGASDLGSLYRKDEDGGSPPRTPGREEAGP